MWGITEKVARADGYEGAMRDLPLERAKAIAKAEYWDKYQCDQFHPEIGFQIFDAAYNGGKVIEWIQRAAGVEMDGKLGAKTIGAVRTMDPKAFMMRFSAYRLRYLASLSVWPSFGKGWANRIAYNLMEAAD